MFHDLNYDQLSRNHHVIKTVLTHADLLKCWLNICDACSWSWHSSHTRCPWCLRLLSPCFNMFWIIHLWVPLFQWECFHHVLMQFISRFKETFPLLRMTKCHQVPIANRACRCVSEQLDSNYCCSCSGWETRVGNVKYKQGGCWEYRQMCYSAGTRGADAAAQVNPTLPCSFQHALLVTTG